MSPRADTPRTSWVGILLLTAVLAVLWMARAGLSNGPEKRIPYSELVSDVESGRIREVEIRPEEIIAKRGPAAPASASAGVANAPAPSASGAQPETVTVDRVPNMDERPLLESLERKGARITGHPERTTWWGVVLGSVLPFLVLPLILFWGLSRAAKNMRGRPMTFGQSRAKLYDKSRDNVATFADVAGVDEAKTELLEIVKFLKEPTRYRALGARVPKGVLLVGAPGTGKTLLARAVAGESGVPFFSMSGSEFVEMFVGVGASRVRDLFEQAKERAPCIIFIDELDAVGKTRSGAHGFASNEEREQTLNQLLVELDGFDGGSGLVIMAATNRPEILDRALLRAGRFDRQVIVDRPDVRGREAILNVHALKIKLAPDVELSVVAQRTPGMVGADLANVVNEAALAAVRRGAQAAAAQDFEEAIDRIQLGLKKEGRVMTPDEKRRVAVHEAGHALVALSTANADPVHRVTIIPRSIGALGATLQLPTKERYLMTREEIRDRICVLFGGRAAEELLCGDISTGAEDDLERATELARQMVCRLGMSDALGPRTFGRTEAVPFLAAEMVETKGISEATMRVIDEEIDALIRSEHARALEHLTRRRPALERIAQELLTHETLKRDDLDALIAQFPELPRPDATPKKDSDVALRTPLIAAAERRAS